MSISRGLKETISDIPKHVGNSIEFIKTEKWEVSKANLLEQKKTIEEDIAKKQAALEEINQLLDMFKD